MNARSLPLRLIVWFTGLVLIANVSFGVYAYLNVKRYIEGVLSNSLQHRAQQIAQRLLPNAAATGQPYIGSEIEARYAPEANDKFVRITRRDRTTLYLSGAPNDHSFLPTAVPAPSWEIKATEVRRESVPNHFDLYIAAVPYPPSNPQYLVEVGAPLAEANHLLHALLWILGGGLLAMQIITVMGGWILIKRALQPVRKIMVAAQDITLKHLDRRLPVPDTDDEIAGLSLVLNRMIERLDESFRNTSRFTADASHELRTPLTIMRGELEEIVSRADLAPEIRDIAASLLEEVERLVRIVEGLFALSRLDAGEAQVERVRINLSALAETTAEQMCLLAEEKNIRLVCDTKKDIEVEGDRARLKQIIVNLLDNAIKYTPKGGTVCLKVMAQDSTSSLEVSDTGPGIPEAALPHVFDRFYRADEVHSRHIDGAGLGLSIVQSICTAHGGSVTIGIPQTGMGCRVLVNLPRAS
jgi:heavy metal sensor kinase